MQTLAQNGNGVAAYIDSLSEAQKALVDEASSTLYTIAKNVNFQVEFNPKTVSEYRLVGYATHHLNREGFSNHKVDAGDIGSGHTMTMIYEITPTDAGNNSINRLRYAEQREESLTTKNLAEYGHLEMRYTLPKESNSRLIKQPILVKQDWPLDNSDVKFSIAVASFAQYLKGGKYTGDMSLSNITEMARANKGEDKHGYRREFISLLELVEIAEQ